MAAWFLTEKVSMDAVSELNTETPRAAAVVGAAIIDAALTATLLEHFREGQTREQLFNPSGGRLGDYDTKKKLAYLRGIISTQAAKDIGTIGQIRNKFAHRLDITSFDDEIIATLCKSLKLIETAVGSLAISSTPGISVRFMESDLEQKLGDSKSRFILSVKIITNALINRPDEELFKPFLPRELI
jgi:DNA-binding MltR family transcriptional regulator